MDNAFLLTRLPTNYAFKIRLMKLSRNAIVKKPMNAEYIQNLIKRLSISNSSFTSTIDHTHSHNWKCLQAIFEIK